MRVLGIPSRVVTVFNAAHDSDGNTTVEEFYSTTGVKLGLSKDSIWLVSFSRWQIQQLWGNKERRRKGPIVCVF